MGSTQTSHYPSLISISFPSCSQNSLVQSDQVASPCMRHKDAPLRDRKAPCEVEFVEIPVDLQRAVANGWILKSQDPLAAMALILLSTAQSPSYSKSTDWTGQNDSHPCMSLTSRVSNMNEWEGNPVFLAWSWESAMSLNNVTVLHCTPGIVSPYML